MSQPDPKIAELESRLDKLIRTQIDFQHEVTFIRKELSRLKGENPEPPPVPVTQKLKPPILTTKPDPPRPTDAPVNPPTFGYSSDSSKKSTADDASERMDGYFSKYADNARENLEKFIGENLISKVGIVVLIVGVGIGAKYAIDNGWISPLLRIIFGYAMGVGLLVFAIRLKPKYHDFSAVLTSGSMATMYFITYFAYSSYGLIPQSIAFVLMGLFTIFTVAASMAYDRQVVAHIGLVGAYAVPFLLSNDSGNYLFLFIYMAVLNAGVLAISIAKNWRPIFYTASVFTWVIFASWFGTRFDLSHYHLAVVFTCVFFLIFYATRLVHAVVHSNDGPENLASTVITAIIPYGLFLALADQPVGTPDLAMLFGSMSVLGLIILVSSYRVHGRYLVFVAMPLSWLVFVSWMLTRYSAEEHFVLAWVFAAVIFLVLYGATICYQLISDEIGLTENASMVMANSFIFYGVTYAVIDSRPSLQQFEGLLTAGHAAFHSVISQIVGRFRPHSVHLVQVLVVLIITLTTIAAPVQFDGKVLTLVWSIEAAVLFFFGRVRSIRLFDYLSYPVMALAIGSLSADWFAVYADRVEIIRGGSGSIRVAFANGEFYTGLVFVAAITAIYRIDRRYRDSVIKVIDLRRLFDHLLPAVGILALYNALRMEIGNLFFQQAMTTGVGRSMRIVETLASDRGDMGRFNVIAQLTFSAAFVVGVSVIDLKKVRSLFAAVTNVTASFVWIGVTFLVGFPILYHLRVNYLLGISEGAFGIDGSFIEARYVIFAALFAVLVTLYAYARDTIFDTVVSNTRRITIFDAVFFSSLFVTCSFELMNIAAHLNFRDADKYGLSILWGAFALGIIAGGIATGKKYLRISGIVLLAVTLTKLFMYDITELGTVPKTILFLALGILLLVVSFLYNKYKDFIFGSDEKEIRS